MNARPGNEIPPRKVGVHQIKCVHPLLRSTVLPNGIYHEQLLASILRYSTFTLSANKWTRTPKGCIILHRQAMRFGTSPPEYPLQPPVTPDKMNGNVHDWARACGAPEKC
jgi:hypothetical protein